MRLQRVAGRLATPPLTAGIRYSSAVIARLLMSASAGTQVLLAAIVLVDPPAVDPDAGFTTFGRSFVIPENDVVFYLVGILLSLALFTATTFLRPASNRQLSATAAVSAALGLLAGHLWMFSIARGYRLDAAKVPAAPAVAMLTLLAISLAAALLAPVRRPDEQLAGGSVKTVPDPNRSNVWVTRFIDLAMPVALTLLIFVPGWRLISGREFVEENFVTWDFFSMGPALAFLHGSALGTDAYSNYGFGWPVVFALLDPLLPLSYGHMILAGVVFAIAYYLGVYVVLRMITPGVLWAAFGTILAVFLTVFNGTEPNWPIWRFPSSTPMRSPIDILVFIALATHLKSGNRAAVTVAGGLVGLAIFFETDTGLYLAAGFGLYCLLGWRSRVHRISLPQVAVSAGAALTMLVLGLGVGSRWTLLEPGFLKGWLENLLQAGSGYTMLPLSAHPSMPVIAGFVVVTLVYLMVLGNGVTAAMQHRGEPWDVGLAALAFYGLLTMLQFVGRSVGYNLFHPLVPFAIIVTCLSCAAVRRFPDRSGSISRAAPFALTALLLGAFASSEIFRSYPGVLRPAAAGANPGVCALRQPRDVCGLEGAETALAEQFAEEADHIAALRRTGATVAVIDNGGPALYLQAETPPWGRYSSVLWSTLFEDQVERVRTQLAGEPPDYVLIPAGQNTEGLFLDVWEILHRQIEKDFTLESLAGQFEVWKLR